MRSVPERKGREGHSGQREQQVCKAGVERKELTLLNHSFSSSPFSYIIAFNPQDIS